MDSLERLRKILDALPGGEMRRLRRELARPYTYIIDILRGRYYITTEVMFSNFREKYSLPERKAFKVATLLELPHLFFLTLDTRVGMSGLHIPANTVLEGTFIAFYAYLEQSCVQPPPFYEFNLEREWERYSTLMPYILDDLRIIFGGRIPPEVQGQIEKLEATRFGTKRATSPEELLGWRKIATDAAWGFWRALNSRRGVRNEAYEYPNFFVYAMFEKVFEEINLLVASENDCTELVRRVIYQ